MGRVRTPASSPIGKPCLRLLKAFSPGAMHGGHAFTSASHCTSRPRSPADDTYFALVELRTSPRCMEGKAPWCVSARARARRSGCLPHVCL